jgi:hypothetical protein
MGRFFRYFFIVCCFLSSSALIAQDINWEMMDFFGGHVPKLSLDRESGDLYAGSKNSGVFKWDSEAGSWNQIGMPDSDIQMLHVTPDGNLWVGLQAKLLTTSNDGVDWSEVQSGLFIPTAMNAVDSEHLYVGGYSGAEYQLRYSENSGESWSTLLTLSRFEQITDIEIDNDGAIYVSALMGGGVFHSSDNGANWTEIFDGTVYDVLVLDNAILVGTDRNLQRSVDDGANWEQVGPNSRFSRMDIDSRGNIFGVRGQALGAPDIHFSDDSGENWSIISTGFPAYCQILDIVVNRANDLISVSTNISGVYQGNDAENLTQINDQLSALYIQQIAISGNDQFFVAAYRETPGTSIWRSENGSDWTVNSQPELGFNPATEIVISNEGSILCSTANTGLQRSEDNGETFSLVQVAHPNVMDVASTPAGDLFAGMAGFPVHHSDDDGESWSPTEETTVWVKSLISNADGDVYAGSAQGQGVFLSSDMGESWEPINDGFFGGGAVVNDLACHQASGTVIAAIVNNGFYRYSPENNIWTAANEGLPHGEFSFSTHGNRIFIADNGVAFAGIQHVVGQGIVEYGIFRSNDFGENWEDVSFNIKHKIVNDFAITSDGKLAVATNGCIYISDTSVLSIEQTYEPAIPRNLEMSAYPNPFNNRTTLRFALPLSGKVGLSVYDLSGRKAMDLVNGNYSAGVHEIVVNGADLAGGTYMLHMNTNAMDYSQKLVLVK